MAEAIYHALGDVLTRWTMGSAGAPAAGRWREAIGGDSAEAELRLLALSGQFLGSMVVAEPVGALASLPDLPPLALPTVPASLRPLVRRAMASMKDTRLRGSVPEFVAARGWTAHPSDWMPAASDEESPAAYAPWRDWAAAVAAGGPARQHAGDLLTEANWADWWPAQRVAALTVLRKREPGAARALLEARLAGEGAEVRLRLLGVLAAELSEGDAPFLETLAAGDRAPKVKALAASLLARLGRGAAMGEEAAELAGFFELRAKGLLRRKNVVVARPLKTEAQRSRRGALFAAVEIAGFAAALGLGVAELAEAWSWWEDVRADIDFAAMAERAAPDAVIAQIATTLLDQSRPQLAALLAMVPRIAAADRRAMAQRILRGGSSYQDALTLGGVGAGLDQVTDLPADTVLRRELAAADARPDQGQIELFALGLVASRAGAERALARLAQIGMIAADSRLDMLRLNAALEDRQ